MTNKYWFKRKKYGYGATPVTWEGWAVTIGFIVVVGILATTVLNDPRQYVVNILILTLVLILIVARKTEGGLKWQWG